MTNPDGELLRVLASELEVARAALRRQEDALAQTAAMLDLIVRQMTGIYWVVDRDLTITRAGGALDELLGYSQERFVGTSLAQAHAGMLIEQPEAAAVCPPDSPELHRRVLAGETVTFPGELRGKHLVTTMRPYRVGDEIVGALGTCVDVTAHHLLERRVVEAQRAESLGVLTSGLAHDFNNLLAAILGNADLALRALSPRAPSRAPLENIRQAGLRAAELTDQLLAYAGRRGVASNRVVPGPLVDELLRISAATMPNNITVRTELAPELAVRGDPSEIRQVVLNLIANARDALGARGGAIAITGRTVQLDGAPHPDDVLTPTAGTYVALEVTDDGPGMTVDVRRRIFDPFFTTKHTGHGLGLAAVVGIVRAHGGGLRLATAPGAGARFAVLWPAMSPTPERASAPRTGHTVLIIDDEDLIRDVVARMVEDLGYAAITATDAPAGLAIVESVPIDAVLLDLAAPPSSSPPVIAALRERRPELPIILCTASNRDLRIVPADAYLAKPFRIDALDQTLTRLLPPRPETAARARVRVS